MKKHLLLILCICYGLCSLAQTKVTINVLDSLSKEPLAYASIFIGKKSALTDDFGSVALSLSAESLPDTLFISMVGYNSAKVLILNQSKDYNIKLIRKEFQLNEVSITGYTNKDLINKFLLSYKNTALINKSFAAYVNTYTTKNINEPIENIKGYYNFNYAAGKLNSIELKGGEVIFPNEEFNKNFLSIGISKLYILLNPYGTYSTVHFVAPYRMPYKKLIETYTFSYNKLENNILKINFLSKNALVQGYTVIDLKNMTLIEVFTTWKFTRDYPLISINKNVSISDTMTISSNTFYHNSKFRNQLLLFDFVYNGEKMKTRSISSYLDSSLHSIPINYIEYNNDYLNILSRPNQSKYSTNIYSTTIGSGKLDSIFNIGVEDASLVNALTLNNDMLTDLTGISFYKDDWRLNWANIGNGLPGKKLDTRIATLIYVDKVKINDTIKYIVEPIFDYAGTTYDYERDSKAASYISNYFHLTKIQSNHLLNELTQSQISWNDNEKFISVIRTHEKLLKKRLWKYKFETNGGNNDYEMSLWNNIIYTELGDNY
jgi:hypothetical protein